MRRKPQNRNSRMERCKICGGLQTGQWRFWLEIHWAFTPQNNFCTVTNHWRLFAISLTTYHFTKGEGGSILQITIVIFYPVRWPRSISPWGELWVCLVRHTPLTKIRIPAPNNRRGFLFDPALPDLPFLPFLHHRPLVLFLVSHPLPRDIPGQSGHSRHNCNNRHHLWKRGRRFTLLLDTKVDIQCNPPWGW